LDGANVIDGVFTIPLSADLWLEDFESSCALAGPMSSMPPHQVNGNGLSPQANRPRAAQARCGPRNQVTDFIAGPENQLLGEAVQSLLSDMPSPYNPLLVYGVPGTGKTHIVQGLCRHWRFRDRHALYSTSADFARGLAGAIEQKTVAIWRAAQRDTSLFVLEEVNHLSDKPAAMGELQQIIDAVAAQQGQVVLTSRLPPDRISGLPKPLAARITGGLVVHVAPPAAAARRAIVSRFAEQRGMDLPQAAARALADGLSVTVPELYGALTELGVQSNMDGSQIDSATVRAYLAARRGGVRPSVRSIAAVSAKYFGIRVADLVSPTRRRAVVQARNVAIYLSRQLAGKSLEQLGDFFGGRDHTTVLHGYRTIERRARTDPEVRTALSELTKKLAHV
jgi:chromosomal replication initiator protein